MSPTLLLIVTYNRLADLKVCVDAARQQSQKCDILVVNNGSSDGTREWLDQQNDVMAIHQENLGGAGGFFAGMTYMMEHNYEFLIMMDDDGVPHKDEVKNLVESYPAVTNKVGKNCILNALVADKADNTHTAFSWAFRSGRSNEIKECQKEPFFADIHPFNGTLIHRSIIEKIGKIKKEMFIWGDEKEYMARAVHNGFGLYTITSALHYHPKEKGVRGNIIPGCSKYQVIVKPEKMSHYYYRNEGFIYGHYPEKKKILPMFVAGHIVYNILHFRFAELKKFCTYFLKGYKNQY